jgi:soluble lytic murein transglycosylase-like protein
MQVLPETAVDMAALDGERLSLWEAEKRLLAAEENIRMGVRYLAHLQRRYADIVDPHRRRSTVLAAYNAGVMQVARVFECPVGTCAQAINRIGSDRFEAALRQLPAETRDYLVKVADAHDGLRGNPGGDAQ